MGVRDLLPRLRYSNARRGHLHAELHVLRACYRSIAAWVALPGFRRKARNDTRAEGRLMTGVVLAN